LDVKEDVPELKIYYDEVDIKNLNQTLSVVVFRVQNSGGAPILNSFYDEKAVPRVVLHNGKFLKVERIAATNEYLKEAALLTVTGETIVLPQIIIEPNESYTIKALLLQDAPSAVPFHVTGKVAGTRQISVHPAERADHEDSFLKRAVAGGFLIQIARGPIYFFGFMFAIFLIFVPPLFLGDKLAQLGRRKHISSFKRYYSGTIDKQEEAILEVYKRNGSEFLLRMRELIRDEKKLSHAMDMTAHIRQEGKYESLEQEDWSYQIGPVRFGVVNALLETGIATKGEDGSARVNKELAAFLHASSESLP
jgi:hypothetical protein